MVDEVKTYSTETFGHMTNTFMGLWLKEMQLEFGHFIHLFIYFRDKYIMFNRYIRILVSLIQSTHHVAF